MRAKVFGFHVHFHDPWASLGVDKVFNLIRHNTLDAMLAICDCIVLMTPMSAQNYHMLDARRLAIMPKGGPATGTIRLVTQLCRQLCCERVTGDTCTGMHLVLQLNRFGMCPPRIADRCTCAQSRGGLIDEKALADALRSGHIRAAALDVHENEPDNLFGANGVIVNAASDCARL